MARNPNNDAALHYARQDLEEARRELASAEDDEERELAQSAIRYFTRKIATLIAQSA